MAPGCPEHLNWQFLAYAYAFRSGGRRRVEEAMRSYSGRYIKLRSRLEVKRFLAGLAAETAGLARTA